MNLLKETKEILEDNNKTIEDIEWIGTTLHYINKEKALELFDNNYDNDYGGQEVANDLIVVGKDWWLERHEYDGSEWWEFKSMPKKPNEELNVETVIDGCWSTLKQMNKKEEEDE